MWWLLPILTLIPMPDKANETIVRPRYPAIRTPSSEHRYPEASDREPHPGAALRFAASNDQDWRRISIASGSGMFLFINVQENVQSHIDMIVTHE